MVNTSDDFISSEMAYNSYDKFYIPIPVLEQSLLSKKSWDESNCAAVNSNKNLNSCDVPSNAVRKAYYADPYFSHSQRSLSKIVQTQHPEDSYKDDFYNGRRHTITPALIKNDIEKNQKIQKG